MRSSRWSTVLSLVACLWAQPGFAQSTPEVGWWWNPDESGRGYFVESQGGIMYLAGYFYEGDGRATWLIAGGPNADPSFYQGRLQSFSQGQTLIGDYKPPTPAVDAGPVTVRFTDNRTGTITWPGGTVPIQRMAFGTGAAGFQPQPGLWWNEAESGRGYNLEVQGDTLFVNAFMYDDADNPVWYLSAGQMTSPTSYEGAWLRFANGQTMGGTYRPPSPPVEVGRLRIEFLADDEAEFTFTVPDLSPPGVSVKRNRRVGATRAFPSPRDFRFPKRYEGSFSYTAQLEAAGGGVTFLNVGLSGSLKLVEQYDPSDPPDPEWLPELCGKPGVPCKVYVAAAESLRRTVYIEFEVGGWKCTGTLDNPYTLRATDFRMEVHADSKYDGEFRGENLFWTLVAECDTPLPPPAHRLAYPWTGSLLDNMQMQGVLTPGMNRTFGPIKVNLTTTVYGNWNLTPVY